MLPRMYCVIHMQLICLPQALICVACRNFSGTPIFPLHKFTPTSPTRGSKRFTRSFMGRVCRVRTSKRRAVLKVRAIHEVTYKRLRGEMDITRRFGRRIRGSNPFGGKVFADFYIF